MNDEMIKNLATHKASLNIWNEESEYDYWCEIATSCLKNNDDEKTAIYSLSKLMKDHYEENNPLSEYTMVYSDIIQWAIACVDWYEIAESFIEHIQE